MGSPAPVNYLSAKECVNELMDKYRSNITIMVGDLANTISLDLPSNLGLVYSAEMFTFLHDNGFYLSSAVVNADSITHLLFRQDNTCDKCNDKLEQSEDGTYHCRDCEKTNGQLNG